ncbi:hypothetical protein EDB86DRAFT_2913623 [Lactarius hatsudake]|nr:hypothetical protein EDB86DRAFT_2913623 [Lactarius hatsudake]
MSLFLSEIVELFLLYSALFSAVSPLLLVRASNLTHPHLQTNLSTSPLKPNTSLPPRTTARHHILFQRGRMLRWPKLSCISVPGFDNTSPFPFIGSVFDVS